MIREPSDLRLEPFFDLSPDLLCIAGFDGFFKKINPAVSKLLGYTQEELFSKPIQEFIFKEDKDITAKYRTLLTENVPLLNFENRYVTKSGEIVWLAWTSMPLSEEKLIYAIAKNITHKKKLEEGRNLLLTNLTQTNKDLKKLSYTTSHDLRSPVNNLLTILGLLDISNIQDEQTLKLIALLKKSTEALKNLLNNNMEVLKHKDSLVIHTEELNLNKSLKEVQKSITSLIENSKTIFKIDFSEVKKVKFNKTYLESIFLNLITNSIKYANPDFSPLISIRTTKVDGVTNLIYSDNGLGFDMEQVKDKIFGLHQKFHDHSDSKGIGLYLVYNHVISLGGQIKVKSKINEGTTFTISFKAEN